MNEKIFIESGKSNLNEIKNLLLEIDNLEKVSFQKESFIYVDSYNSFIDKVYESTRKSVNYLKEQFEILSSKIYKKFPHGDLKINGNTSLLQDDSENTKNNEIYNTVISTGNNQKNSFDNCE